MENLSQIEIVGGLIVGGLVVLAFLKYFLDWSSTKNKRDAELNDKFNERYNEINQKFQEIMADFQANLLENTLTTRNLREYLERLETETKKKLDEHEKRLDEHSEAIIKLSSYKDIKINGGNDD